MKTKLTLEFDNTEEDKRFAKFISYHTEISSALFQITHNLRKNTENFIESKELEPTQKWMHETGVEHQAMHHIWQTSCDPRCLYSG